MDSVRRNGLYAHDHFHVDPDRVDANFAELDRRLNMDGRQIDHMRGQISDLFGKLKAVEADTKLLKLECKSCRRGLPYDELNGLGECDRCEMLREEAIVERAENDRKLFVKARVDTKHREVRIAGREVFTPPIKRRSDGNQRKRNKQQSGIV